MPHATAVLAEIAALRPLRVLVATAGKAPDSATECHRRPRLLLGLVGAHRLRCSGFPDAIALSRGQAIWFPPGAWHAVQPGLPRRYASLTWLGDQVLLYTRCHDGKSGISGPASWHPLPFGQHAAVFRRLLGLAQLFTVHSAIAPGVVDALLGLVLTQVPAEVGTGDRWAAIVQLIDEHRPAGLPCHRLARLVGLHQTTLSRLCRRHTGMGMAEYLIAQRLDAARELRRRQAALTVAELAQRCGWSDTPHFRRCYRSRFGIAPGRDSD